MRKRIGKRLGIFMILSLAAWITGCGSQTAGNFNVNAGGVSARVVQAKKEKLETTVDIAGVLVPSKVVNISAKMLGQVKTVDAEVGDRVNAGQTLVQLETKELNAQLQQARAALQSVEDQAVQARINLDLAQKSYDRVKQLASNGAAPQSQLDDAKNKLDLAQKQYDIATGSGHNQAQAAVDSIRVQLENAVIQSPLNGVVINRNVNAGEIISPGAPVLTIADTSVLKLKSKVSQEMLPVLGVGQRVGIAIDIYPNKKFEGRISQIGPLAVGTGEYFPIEISMDNGDGIKAGLTAHAGIKITSEDGVLIPQSAVVRNNGENYVFVVKDGKASKRMVVTGLKNDSEIAVLKGLESGEQIAVSNVNTLRDDMEVKIEK